jgi:NitT/TauT family transport system substrate-binding protein
VPPRRSPLVLVALTAFALLAAACSPSGSASPAPKGTPPVASIAGPPCSFPGSNCGSLVVGLGYIPSVQFAPFYLAQEAGYYHDVGLSVTFQNQIDPNLVTLVGQGSIDVGLADGTSVVPAASQGIPIQYVATIYGTFPNIVFAKATSGITSAADLKGKRVGTPGKYGSSWVMLQALLGSAKLSTNDVTIVEYPDFGQGTALQQGQIDAATGFTNNEPVQAQLAGTAVNVLHVDQVIALPGPGLIASKATIAAKEPALRAFVTATLKAMRDIAADPSKGLEASIAAVPDLAQSRATQEAILQATIATWAFPGKDASSYGTIDPAAWTATIRYLTTLGLVASPVTASDVLHDLTPTAP